MIYRLVLFAVASCLMCVILKDNFRSGAVVAAFAGCIVLLGVFADALLDIRDEFGAVMSDSINTDAVSLILKTLLVAYLTGFGSDICSDAGEKAIANSLETAGKIIMLSMAVPMLLGIFKAVKEIIGA